MIKPFINNFNWENINFPPKRQDYQQFEMNNNTIHYHVHARNVSIRIIKMKQFKSASNFCLQLNNNIRKTKK